ncbi:MAG TPA: EAL domain-containing protein [Usitatibacter sp.]|jgi:diguanylate cyclase (GGDEF)-like protein/PAS domain S-box-containing protein|nr:EAL domain-containing protein [Usitatibacter sp.]
MRFIDMQDYNPVARRYWWTVTLLGTAALAWSIAGVVAIDGKFLLQVLVGAAVAAVVGLFPVRIPGAKTSIAGAEIFIFLVMLLYGPQAAVIAAALEGLVASWRTSRRWTSRFGTPAMASVAMLACASGFEAIRTHVGPMSGAALISLLFAFAALYFVANMLLTSTLFALKTRSPFTPIKWLKDFGWIGLAYLTGASIAGLLFESFQQFGVPVLLVSVPVIAMFLSTLHSYFQRKESDQLHMEQLKESESRFHSAFTHAAIGMSLVSTEGRFIQANKAFCDMLGRSLPELLASQLPALVNSDDVGALQGPVDRLVKGELASVHTEVRGVHRDGSDVWMSLNISLARDWQFRTHNLIVQAQDISARRRAEAELYHNAYHDSLTQLSNRTHFNEQLNRAIARVQRHPEQRFAVMYLDFDRFKMVNDSLGHKAGDELLVNLARRLKEMLRPTDVLARLGGDEFAILVEDLHRQRDAVELTERIQKELQKPVQLGAMEVAISASIGITFSTNGYQTSDQIIRDADIAMYKAKSKGKAQYALFDSSLHQHVTAQLQLESELRRALGQGQIYLEYQPICSLRDRKLMGFEALVRWNHPERGLLEPATFIPVAEETGLIVPLGNWVLTEACRQMREWRAIRESSTLRMSVNVSSLQLTHPDFVSHVQRALQAADMSPMQLTLEVTESVLMDGIENAVSTLSALRHMGVTLSIDDFGTGYSSLSYLATLPIDALKVDRSFIERMSRDGEGGEIVKAIFKLGQALSKQVFAEGIETGAQLALLQELGCEYGQGFLLSRPVDAARAAGFLHGHAHGLPAAVA